MPIYPRDMHIYEDLSSTRSTLGLGPTPAPLRLEGVCNGKWHHGQHAACCTLPAGLTGRGRTKGHRQKRPNRAAKTKQRSPEASPHTRNERVTISLFEYSPFLSLSLSFSVSLSLSRTANLFLLPSYRWSNGVSLPRVTCWRVCQDRSLII